MPLNDAARAAIAELAGEGVADLTPDEVVRLNDCGRALLDAGRADRDGPAIEPPVECGGLVLHPVTPAAADYIALTTRGRLDGGNMWHLVAALVHAREPEALDALDTRLKRWRETRRLRHRCGATRGEVMEAVLSVLHGDRVDALTDARACAAALCDYVAAADPVLAEFIRHKAEGHFRRHGPEAEIAAAAQGGERPARDVAYWRRLAAELAVTTGTDAAYWMRTDNRIVLRCYKRAQDLALAWGGMFPSAKAVPQEVVEAIREMEAAKNAIRRRRAEAGKEAAGNG